MSAQLDFWESEQVPDSLGERLARLETKLEDTDRTIQRNKDEADHARNNMRMALDNLHRSTEAGFAKINQVLDDLVGILNQAKGAKKTVMVIFAILSFFGLTGVYTVIKFFTGH